MLTRLFQGLLDGSAVVYANHGPQPDGKWTWVPMNAAKPIASGTGVAGADVRFGRMEKTGRHSYLTLSPNTGALRAWLNGCHESKPQSGGPSGSSSSSGTGTVKGQATGTSTTSITASNPSNPGSGPGNMPSPSGGPVLVNPPTGDSLTGEYLGGGKEIPVAGLAALGLAVVGIPAVTSLTPYAITAQNHLTTANEAMKALTAGAATSGGVLAAAGAVEVAAKGDSLPSYPAHFGFGALSQQVKAWDLSSLPGLKGEAQKQQKALAEAAKSLSDLVPRLQGCGATIKRSDSCPVFFKSAAGTVGGKSTVTPLTWFTQGHEPDLPPFLTPTSGSGGSGGSGGSTLGGGLPFPKGGLHTLGLPTRGVAAINGLKPYAISTQNTVAKALGFLNGLSGGASVAAADVSAAGDSLAAAASALPTPWILNTIPGTSVRDFRAFIQTLPDHGSGKQMIFEGSDYQNYVTNMTKAEALVVNKIPIVDMMTRNDRVKVARNRLRNHTKFHLLGSRVNNPVVVRVDNQHRYQQMLSARKTERISLLIPDIRLGYQYHYEQTAGLGRYVYVFDSGFDVYHQEIISQAPETHVIPGLLDDTGAPVPDIRDDGDGHGTGCAALVGGVTLGIAKKAKIVLVKMMSNDEAKPEDMIEAWRWAIEDARSKNRLGKTVFSLSIGWPTPESDLPNQQHFPAYYRPPFNIPAPVYADWWPPLLAEAWRGGIVTVFSAGNLDPTLGIVTQGVLNPSRYTKANNPIVNVGSVDDDGKPSAFNLPARPHPAYVFDRDLTGEHTVFAHASEIYTADRQPSPPYTIKSGTSFACPQVAGLAAYFLGLPNTVQPANADVAMAVKRQLVRLARDNSVDAPKLAYNGVWDTPCGALTKREKAELLAEEAGLVLGKLKNLHLAQSLAV
ncbi:MAG: hypothetical protein Q9169_001391 [Polycauliona sp. 2 TL-2023]